MAASVAANAALSEAVRNGILRDVKRAIKNRADVACRDDDGLTPAMLAARLGDVEIVDVLVQHNDSDLTHLQWSYEYIGDALHTSAACGQMEVATVLLRYGADKDFKTPRGVTPLMYAATRGPTCTIQLLLDWSADIQARMSNGITALHLVARSGRFQATQLLVARGADVDAVDNKLITPLVEGSTHV